MCSNDFSNVSLHLRRYLISAFTDPRLSRSRFTTSRTWKMAVIKNGLYFFQVFHQADFTKKIDFHAFWNGDHFSAQKREERKKSSNTLKIASSFLEG